MPLLKSHPPIRLLFSSLKFIKSFSSSSFVYSFEDNSNGALGLSSSHLLDSYEPTKIQSLPTTIAGVAAGHYHSLAVTADGDVWAWGRNVEGQLGRGANSPRDTWNQPARVVGLCHVSAQAAFASGVVSAAIGDDGSIWVWGRSKRGQLSLGKDVIEALKPTKVDTLSDHEMVKSRDTWNQPARVVGLCHVSAQAAFASGVVSAAIGDDGSIWVWGRSKRGQLGLGKDVIEALKPTKVDTLSDHEMVKDSHTDDGGQDGANNGDDHDGVSY